MAVSEKTYEAVALEDPEGNWERHCGELRRKPEMTQEHNDAASILGFYLQQQLPLDDYRVRVNMARARREPAGNYIPDVMVIPVGAMKPRSETPGGLEQYTEPLPFVAEVWSPSTGEYDVETKFPEYRARGDGEIWRVHPYERTVIAWRRQADGSYSESLDEGGEIPVVSLPGVVIPLESLFR
jgi:Uma2 family endonuclease